MKRNLIYFTVAFFGVACLFFLIFGYGRARGDTNSRYTNIEQDGKLTFLCVGFDELGRNTDSLILASLDTDIKKLSLLQIPRDTYFSKGTTNGKINQLYASYYEKTKNHTEAMEMLKETVSKTFSVPIDFYFALNLSTLASVVDKLGGIEIDIPYDLYYNDPEQNLSINLKKGEQVLDGERALYFVRYRFGYLEGDVGRVDAQKLFLSAFLNKIRQNTKITTGVSILKECISGNTTDAPAELLLLLATKVLRSASEYQIYYMTLPGEATRQYGDNGLSYYVVNRMAASDMLSKYGFGISDKSDFDRNQIMVNKKLLNFTNIYNAPNFGYTVYTDDEIKNIKINLKS